MPTSRSSRSTVTIKALLVALALALGVGAGAPRAAQADQLTDALLGNAWYGGEYDGFQWGFVWERSGKTNYFRARWSHPKHGSFTGTVRIVVDRPRGTVTIYRPPAGGVGCTYHGTITMGSAGGTYTCDNGYTGPWRAHIR